MREKILSKRRKLFLTNYLKGDCYEQNMQGINEEMHTMEKIQENKINATLTALHEKGLIPLKSYSKGKELYRVQGTKYDVGYNFSKTMNSEEMGRYSDPNGKVGVCYAAESPVTAMAEVYNRRQSKTLSLNDLDSHNVCVIKLAEYVNTVDMGKLLPHLNITIDEISSKSYVITQLITSFFVRLNNEKYSGISYRSRHYEDDYCVALFEKPSCLLTDVSKTPLREFEKDGLDGEEIITTKLAINVM